MVHRVRVSASSPFGREVLRALAQGHTSGSGTYVRTPSLRCSMCLIEWSVRSSEDVFRSVVEMGCVNGSDM